MANTSTLSAQGLIEIVYEGDQNYDTVSPMINQAILLANQQRSASQPVLVLVDLSRMGQSTPSSRQATVEGMKKGDYDKVAIFGASVFLKHLANLLAAAIGKQEKIRSFESREEAEAWLTQS